MNNTYRVATELKNGIDRTGEVKSDTLRKSNINFTSDFNELSKANFHIITVPTPIDDAKKKLFSILKF